MNKTKAVQYARGLVTPLYKFGNNYRHNWFDKSVSCWRESNLTTYGQALYNRSQTLVDIARGAMGLGSVQYDGGNWENYLEK